MTDHNQTALLDHGFVRFIDSMGTDLSIVRAARVSHDAAWRAGENGENDRRLMRRLWTGGRARMPETPKHSTPFEAVTVTFEIQAPIFVFRQWHRHRTQSYNELSARYRPLPSVWYIPDVHDVGRQSTLNKQGRSAYGVGDEEIFERRSLQLIEMQTRIEEMYAFYQRLLDDDWPKELARICLPFAMYSHMFATANLKNWLGFLSLRCDKHAQWEIRVYADAIASYLERIVPETIALWRQAMAENEE